MATAWFQLAREEYHYNVEMSSIIWEIFLFYHICRIFPNSYYPLCVICSFSWGCSTPTKSIMIASGTDKYNIFDLTEEVVQNLKSLLELINGCSTLPIAFWLWGPGFRDSYLHTVSQWLVSLKYFSVQEG